MNASAPEGLAAAGDAAHCLGPEGAFARRDASFSPRVEQQEMAAGVASALAERRVLVCEAGTGTGKTYAYLVPLLQAGERSIISTGTRALQDQLFHKDLPRVRDALGIPLKARLLKGRSNYLCLHRLDLHLEEFGRRIRGLGDDLRRIRAWADRTVSGDIGELDDLPEHLEAWRYATSTVDNCLGQDCPRLAECHVARARREALEADVVVVNHHLLFADLALKDEGFGELLPGASAVVVDEAHQVPAVASRFFSTSVSARQLRDLARDALSAYHQEAGDHPDFEQAQRAVDGAVEALHRALGTQPLRVAWVELGGRDLEDAWGGCRVALTRLAEQLELMAPRGKDLARCHDRALLLLQRLERIAGSRDEGELRWLDTGRTGFVLHLTPLSVAETFGRQLRDKPRAWVFTSATLSVAGSFEHFTRRLGIDQWQGALWDSPFDFRAQALCYLPPGLPPPGDRAFLPRVLEAVVPVLEASRGRAFFLFTSHRALQWVARELRERVTFPLLVQGERPRHALLDRFRSTPGAVLLGTASFWEGVDVRGEALSCVIIDKLPFAPPDDPLVQARSRAIREAGGNPFLEYQVPEAVITLKQGAGRLIRDVADRGVLVLCDPRLTGRDYGRVFLESLPPMTLTRDLDDVRGFFAEEGAAPAPVAGP